MSESESIENKNIVYLHTIKFALTSVITKLLADSLDNIINHQGNVSTFLRNNFKYWCADWSCQNEYLKRANEKIKHFYDANNKTYPNSLRKIDLDITSLLAITKNLLGEHFKKLNLVNCKESFDIIKKIRNACCHTNQISKNEFINMEAGLIRAINIIPFIHNNDKEIYQMKLNCILKNLVIVNAKYIINLQKNFVHKSEFNQLKILMEDLEKKVEKLCNEKCNLEMKVEKIDNENCNLNKRLETNSNEINTKIEKINNEYSKLSKILEMNSKEVNDIKNSTKFTIVVYYQWLYYPVDIRIFNNIIVKSPKIIEFF